MLPRSAEIFCPGIRDFYATQTEAVDRVLQEPGLLAGRFYEGRRKLGLHDLYRDARKPTATSYVSQTPGMKQRFVQVATQRIENVGQYDPVLVPGADHVRTIIVSEKVCILQQALAPTSVETQPPGRHLCLKRAKRIHKVVSRETYPRDRNLYKQTTVV